MTKKELINLLIRKAPALGSKKVCAAVNIIIDEICDNLEDGGRTEIRGFGSFKLHWWGPRYARNPETGENWRTVPVYSVHFKPGKELRDRINDSRHRVDIQKLPRRITETLHVTAPEEEFEAEAV